MERTIKELQAEKINVHGMPCHVGKDADRKALVQETMAKFGGRIDAFVSNAAVNPAYGPILDTTEDQWDKLFDINVKAAFLLCKGVSLPSSASAAPRASSMQSKLLATAAVRCNMLPPVARSCTECLAIVALCRGFADNAEAAGRLGCLCIVYRGVHSKPGHYYTYLAAGTTQEPPPHPPYSLRHAGIDQVHCHPRAWGVFGFQDGSAGAFQGMCLHVGRHAHAIMSKHAQPGTPACVCVCVSTVLAVRACMRVRV